MKTYDSIIIGSGQAGTPLAFTLAKKGKKVAFIEKTEVGGTCLNIGCTPTKTYVASARRMWDIANSSDVAIDFKGEFSADLNKVKRRKDVLISKSVNGINEAIKNNENIDYYFGEASFVSNYEVVVNDERLTAPQIFINVGGRPIIPDEYKELPYLTSSTILELTKLPEHLIIVGGSYIGLEFGQIFKRFGSKVTIIERGDRVIKREDEDVSEVIQTFLTKEDVDFVFNAQKVEASEVNGKISVVINNEIKVTGSHILLAVGRMPNTDKLNLLDTDIERNERGIIPVNDYCQTNVDGIFALGDCNGKGAFTHTAYNDFQIVKEYLFGDKSRKISDRIMTYGLFVDPPLGRCGFTKAQAISKGINVLEARREMKDIARAREKSETFGHMSILIDADTKLIVGATILGTGGDEIITSILNIMSAKQPYDVIRDTMVLHPTVSELIPTALERLNPII